MSSQKGRPKSENPKTDRLYIRIAPDEKKEIKEFSNKNEIGLLDLLRLGVETLRNKKK